MTFHSAINQPDSTNIPTQPPTPLHRNPINIALVIPFSAGLEIKINPILLSWPGRMGRDGLGHSGGCLRRRQLFPDMGHHHHLTPIRPRRIAQIWVILYQYMDEKISWVVPETQKVKTFRSAEFHSQKISGRSA